MLMTIPTFSVKAYFLKQETKIISETGLVNKKEQLLQNIQIRIKELIDNNVTITSLFSSNSQDDSDGPYIGGLDDKSDFSALFWGILGLLVFLPLSLKLVFNPQNILQFIGGILGSFAGSYNALMNFGEAFDLIEYVEDGC
jgi:hypothetical protein